jgi:hypothetical protein
MSINTEQVTAKDTINDADLATLANAARELTQSDIIGLPLRFVKGRWYVILSKNDRREVTATEIFVVDPVSYAEGWYKWKDNKPVIKIIGRRVDGFISPPRSALPDLDKRLWPGGKNGPEDPWQERQGLLLKDLATDELLTWVNDTYGGRRYGLGEFLKNYLAERKKNPGFDPIVGLESWERDTDYGKSPTPRLKIIGWQPFGEGRTPPGDPTLAGPAREALLMLPKPRAVLAPPDKAQQQDNALADEIPF